MKPFLRIVFSALFFLSLWWLPAEATAGESDFFSLHFSQTNVRSGPGYHYPIFWVYTKKGIPLRVIGRFGEWRQVQDWEGQEGWIHRRLLSRHRRAIVLSSTLARFAPVADAPGSVRIQAGVMVDVLDCADAWCQVSVAGYRGWMPDRFLWGGS